MLAEADSLEAVALVFGHVYAWLHASTVVARLDYENLLRAARRLYVENRDTRAALADLERLASSWTGTPERSRAIVRARAVLAEGRP